MIARGQALRARGVVLVKAILPVLGLLALVACGQSETREAAAQGPVVQVVEVASAQGAGVVRASGLVGFKVETPLSFSAPGVIGSILVDEGDQVRRGQRLATLRRTGATGDTNEAAMARATAQRDLQRTETLFERGFASQAALDDARLAAQRASDFASISAPAGGVILRRLVEPAQTVGAATTVLVLGDVASGVVVRASVPSSAAARIEVGDVARVATGEGVAFEGAVTRVSAKSDDTTGAFEVEVRIAAPGALRSGMVADVEIAAEAAAGASEAIVAPVLSLLDARADQGVVFVVDAQNVARRRAVRTSGLTDGGVLIVEGLSAGERIVAAGAAYVRDGEPVRLAPPADG